MPSRGAVAFAMLAVALGALAVASAASPARAADRPNVLWITAEDISPNMGCYGDSYAVTPNIDRLATQGVLYTNAFATIGVCAPARSTLITGMYPPSIGSQHMRCQGKIPAGVRFYPEYLRDLGYYCTNNSKTDYNLPMRKGAWDENSNKAHWRKRKEGQPFFAIFNFTTCHESQIRISEKAYEERVKDFKPQELHDPAKAPLPPYHPDAPEVRRDWARYADMITYMDKQVGHILKQLEDDGLAEDTIVFFYSDHGAGMPRSKRWLYDSSLRVPLIIRFPEKYKHLAPADAPQAGARTDRLASFIDFAPTLLSLCGLKQPEHMQGQAFLGEHAAPPRQYVHGFRDRMDDRYDMIRCVRDGRYKYIRNFMPQHPWFGHDQYISYMYQMPTMRVWQQLYDEGKLDPVQAMWFKPKPVEELYDTQADPHEINNLAGHAEHAEALSRMRGELKRWMFEIKDLGLLPEADMRSRFGNTPEYDAVRADPDAYPMEKIFAAAELASERNPENVPKLVGLLARSNDPAERWWGAVGLTALGKDADRGRALDALREAVHEPSPSVRVMAAAALANIGHVDEALPVLAEGLQDENDWVRLRAANLLDQLNEKARPVLDAIKAAEKDKNDYVQRVVKHTLEAF